MATVPQAERIREGENGVLTLDMSFAPSTSAEAGFTRADLLVDGIPHREASYSVRVFFNAPNADADTPVDSGYGYAGKFSVFGHGGCFGADGHCDTSGAPLATGALAVAQTMPHPLAPKRKVLTVTAALRQVLEADQALTQITFVPIRSAPKRSDCKPEAGLFRFSRAMIQTYR